MVGFLRFYTQVSLVKGKKIQSFKETAHWLTWCFLPLSMSLAGLPVFLSLKNIISSRFHLASLSPRVWHKTTSRCPIISVSLHFFIRMLIGEITPRPNNNSAFFSFSTLGSLTQGQSPECKKSSSCFLFISRWSTSARHKPCYLMYILIHGVVGAEPKTSIFS